MTYPNPFELQKQNEMRKIAEAQNRIAMIDQQVQAQQQYMPQNNMNFGQQPQPQFLGISGKFIQAPENITANDVPMDGSVALFPFQDMSQILAKAWQSDGTIKTIAYKPVEPVLDDKAENTTLNTENLKFGLSDDVTDMLSQMFGEISERLDKMEKSIGKPKTTTRAKKDGETE